MRSLRALALLVALVGPVVLTAPADDRRAEKKAAKKAKKAEKKGKAAEDKSEFAHIGDLNAEVTVLNVLHTLQPTAGQLKAIVELSPKTMQKPPPRKMVKVSERFRKALAALRDALVAGDDDKVEELYGKLDELRQKEDPEFDEVEITDAAREQAPALLRRFSARQVADYIASVAEFPDPVERLTQAMAQGRKLRGKEWQGLRDDTAYQFGWLVAGLDAAAEEKARDRATALLNKAYRLEEKAYAKQRDDLEKEARALVGKLGPTDVLRHFMERVLAETLSSHQLVAAIEARGKK
jgi:hypothetical protein